MVVVGSWSKTERIYPLYNITRLDGLRQMRADYKKFDTTWEQRSKKNSVWPAKKFFFSIKISDVQQKGAKKFHKFCNKTKRVPIYFTREKSRNARYQAKFQHRIKYNLPAIPCSWISVGFIPGCCKCAWG